MKTAERAHTPKELWESIKLDPSYNKALEQIDNELKYWPNFLKHKCKQRFTRLRQILIKRKKMKLEGRAEYKVVSHKAEKREKTRLVKAEKSAVIENHIVNGLLENLKNKKYDEIYNYSPKVFKSILEEENVQDDVDEEFNEDEYDKGYIEDFSDEEEENEDDENNNDDENNEDNEKNDDEEIDDIFNTSNNKTKDSSKKGKKTGKKRKRQNIEYEKEYENMHKNVNYNINTNNKINDDLDDYL
jgi:protein MAK16